ncbi:MAG: peptide chain release factor N(5)-glutamine methyltransferase [Pseudomonadota bacterium]
MADTSGPRTVGEAIELGRRRLAHRSDSSRLDARVLVSHALGKRVEWCLAHDDAPLTDAQRADISTLVDRRRAGEPVAYLLGQREFWSLTLSVTPDTLIPRPDTEVLVECALNALGDSKAPTVADLGTGSGAVALAIAHARPDATVLATDRCPAALTVASENARRLGLDVAFFEGDWLGALPHDTAPLDLIVSNPPYVRHDDLHLTRGDVRFEPRDALVSAGDGLADISTIARHAPAFLVPGGELLLEHGFDQAGGVRRVLHQVGLTDITTTADLAGQPRVTGGRRPF